MIQLPDNLCDSLFDGKFEYGCIIKTSLFCTDGQEKPNYFITITRINDLTTQVFVVATSQIEFYNKHPNFNREIIRLPANQLSYFPKETVIDCRRIHKFERDVLKRRFRDNTLEFIGVFPGILLKQLKEIIRQSYFIAKKEKDLILDQGI